MAVWTAMLVEAGICVWLAIWRLQAEGRALAGSKARLQPSQAHFQWPNSVSHDSPTKTPTSLVSVISWGSYTYGDISCPAKSPSQVSL